MPTNNTNTEIVSQKKTSELKPKQRLFAENYLIDNNATRAYKEVYGFDKTDEVAATNASKLLRLPKVSIFVRTLEDKLAKQREIKTGITKERILLEFSRIAFLDPRKLFDEQGNLKAIIDLDDDTAAAIAGIDISSVYKKSLEGATKDELMLEVLKKIKLVDKKGALDSLARTQGMFIDKSELSISQTNTTKIDPTALSDDELTRLGNVIGEAIAKMQKPKEIESTNAIVLEETKK